MLSTVSRTMRGISTYASVVTSPATCTSPVVTMVSTATRLPGSCSSMASRIASRDLVTDLVGVTLGDGLGREQACGHPVSPSWQRLLTDGACALARGPHRLRRV